MWRKSGLVVGLGKRQMGKVRMDKFNLRMMKPLLVWHECIRPPFCWSCPGEVFPMVLTWGRVSCQLCLLLSSFPCSTRNHVLFGSSRGLTDFCFVFPFSSVIPLVQASFGQIWALWMTVPYSVSPSLPRPAGVPSNAHGLRLHVWGG